MKIVNKLFFSILAIVFVSIILSKNVVYADVLVGSQEIINYSPLYYLTIIVVISIVVGISILILRKIYKDNQLEKENNEKIEKGVEKQ